MSKIVLIMIFTMTSISAFSEATLFDDQKPLIATLEMDLTSFRENKEELRENGLLGIFKVEGKVFDVEVLSRGHGSFDNTNTPFKLVFDKVQREGTLFDGIKKIKAFVAAESDAYDERIILSNFLTYKLVEKLTPHHFKTRLFEITYIDTSGNIPPYTSTTFLMEPNKVLAKRLGSQYIPMKFGHNERIDVVMENLDTNAVERITALEFLLGNFDHAIPGVYSGLFSNIAQFEKNMKMLLNKEQKYIPVAYDFDFTGTIDRGVCMWEIGIGVQLPERTDHIATMTGTKCDKFFVQKHLKVDLANYKHKESVFKYKNLFIKSMREWKSTYRLQIDRLSKDYLYNIDVYLEVLQEL
jgi:hypothetical protein